LPPSVLFRERRVYRAPVLLVVTAFRQGRSPDFTFQRLKLLRGPWRSTINRWRRCFTELFAESAVWRRVSGRLMPPVAAQPAGALLQSVRRALQRPGDLSETVGFRPVIRGPDR